MQNVSWRYSLLGLFFAAAGMTIILQMGRIQVTPLADTLRARAEQYEQYRTQAQPIRGEIYDRWGHLLAGNITVYQVGVETQRAANPQSIATALHVVLGLDADKVLGQILQASEGSTPRYVVLTDFISAAQIEELETYRQQLSALAASVPPVKGVPPPSLEGLVYQPHLMRYYPEETLASNVLGFVSVEQRGYFGLEEKFNDLLMGNAREIWVAQNPYKVNSDNNTPSGANLILTLDRQIQDMVEEILQNAIEANGAASGTTVVMDPKTGEILAMVSTPQLNANEYWRYPDIFRDNQTPFNRAISQAYEPGSVFKVLTMAAALDAGEVTPETEFVDQGVFEIGGIFIRNWNGEAWGPQTMVGCMQHSLNVCLAWVASKLGTPKFYAYMQAFGIGRRTGIDLAGEATGYLKRPGDSNWYEADLGTNAFGQGVSATPIQMVTAIGAIANQGKMVTPHVVKAIVDRGYQYDIPVQVFSQPVSEKTAATLSEMLAQSLEAESSIALVPGYRLAGKTGTAEIPTPYGYTSDVTNASFIGWGPVDDPRFIVYVWLEKPTSSIWGSVVAAPVFRQIVERLVVLMDIPPDEIRKHTQTP
ncbi:MAG: stage V sporulation protein D [Anaerolineales bacterium]